MAAKRKKTARRASVKKGKSLNAGAIVVILVLAGIAFEFFRAAGGSTAQPAVVGRDGEGHVIKERPQGAVREGVKAADQAQLDALANSVAK